MLSECAFVSNDTESDWCSDPTHQYILAKAHAKAICSYLGVQFNEGGIDMVEIPDWMAKGGREGLQELQKQGLIMGAEQWGKNEELAKYVPAALFWMILGRIVNKGGK